MPSECPVQRKSHTMGLEKFTRVFLEPEYESAFQANGPVATELQWDASLHTGCVLDTHL